MVCFRVGIFVVSVALAVVFLTTRAQAQWSFDFSSARNDFVYGLYGQLGANGFFGPYDLDASSTGGRYASLNGWVGNRRGDIGELVSGTNASLSSTNLAAQPRFESDWVEVVGRYTINSYQTASSQGTYVTMSPGQLTLWSMLVTTPVGSFSWGKGEFIRGFGLQFGASRSEEYFAFERWTPVPNLLLCLVRAGILPRRALSWFNPAGWPRYCVDPPTKTVDHEIEEGDKTRHVIKTSYDFDERYDVTGPYWEGTLGTGDLLLGVAVYPWQRIQTPSSTPIPGLNPWNPNDLNAARSINYAVYFLYDSTDLALGAGGTRVCFHVGPELQSSVLARRSAPTIEQYLTEGWAFLRYSNGTILLRAEADWFNQVIRYQRSLDGTFFGVPDNTDGSGSRFAPDYRESWRYMLELGYFWGPVSASVFHSFLPGPDRRHGIRIDRQPFVQDEIRAAFGIFEPYSILLSYYYGGGVAAPAHINDASIFATKIEYMLASNLIIEASILKAFRTSNGYGLGYIRPSLIDFGSVDYGLRGSYSDPAPGIPSNDLGWELTTGLTWKLLEEFVVQLRLAYWKPGRWFNYACIDKSVPNWDTPTSSNNWGVNPNRDIDPVFGMEMRVGAKF